MTATPDRASPRLALRDRPAADRAAADRAAARSSLGLSRPDQPVAARPFATVALFDNLQDCAAVWLQLQAVASASPYQTLAWASAWADTEGRAAGTRLLTCVAQDARGRPVALLPLALSRKGAVTVATFLGGRHSNYNLGLFDPAIAWSRGDIEQLLRTVARAAPVRPDLFALTNQAHAWDGWSNPLAQLPGQASPSQGHRAVLVRDGETFLQAHLSSSARKKMRSKAAQLNAQGPVRHLVARSTDEISAVLGAYHAQKAAKLASIGAGARADLVATGRLLARAATTAGADGRPVLELHALLCGDRIVATFGALTHAGRCSGLMISHDADQALARLSPGELLLAAVVGAKCADGLDSFDLGIGEARYKQSFCPIVDPLFDSLVPVTGLGRLYVAQEALRLRLKGRIKQSRWAWPMLLRLRKRLAGRQGR